MSTYSKSFERDENRMMNKALLWMVLAVLFCWAPIWGLFCAVSGFFRMCVRVTRRHRVKRALLTILSILILLASVALHIGGVYHYVKNPAILEEGTHALWKTVTGQDSFPWEGGGASGDFYDYNYVDDPYAEGDMTPTPDETPAADASYFFGDDGYDDEFDESVLDGFDEEAPDAASESADRALFDQMLESRSQPNAVIP